MCASLHEEWDATKHMGFVPFHVHDDVLWIPWKGTFQKFE